MVSAGIVMQKSYFDVVSEACLTISTKIMKFKTI